MQHLQEAEENEEAPDAPIVPGLRPPSPRPMVHDPLDRQENEPQGLPSAAELARYAFPGIGKHCCLTLSRYQVAHLAGSRPSRQRIPTL